MSGKRRAGQGALFILALLLASSGALRIGSDIGVALARSGTNPEPQSAEVEPKDCPAPPLALAEALKLREQRIAAQEAAINDRLAAVALADEAINRRMTEMQTLEASLKATIAVADGAAEADLARLTAVYETMKPKDAAALFEAMAPEFAAGFLGRMRPEAAAAVLSGMSSEAAYSVSVIVAGRNAKAPTE
jgi:flagellar motility protein MotE (MotC chaperone)